MENREINPWLHIWIHPKKTMRSILNTDPKKAIIWLAILAGILSGFSFIALSWYPLKTPSHYSILFALMIILGAIFGIALLYFFGWLYTLIGSWIGGKGSFIDIKSAVGWSNYPFIFSNLCGILHYFSRGNLWFQALFGLLSLAFWVWGLIIFFALISEAHRFSVGKAILMLIISFILLFAVLMIIALIVPLLKPLFQ